MTLIINNLSKNYDDEPVIKNISMKIEDGEIFGIFGDSGAGETVLMQILAGEIEGDNGSISFDGENLTDANRRAAIAALAADNFSEHSADQLNERGAPSKGERQILEFEKILNGDAQVFLFDNPFCFLDRAARENCAAELRKVIAARNRSAVFASSDFNEIFSVCDRVAILSGGAIIQTGTPREVYENPNSAAAVAATGRVNLIAAKILSVNKTGASEFQTLIGGHRIFADNVTENSAFAVNQNLTLAIRPEHVSISFGASFPEDNLLRARISGVKYAGATTLIELDAEGLPLQALVLRLVGLKVGDECVVGMPPNRILILAD